MAAGPFIKSALKAGIDALPDTMKAENLAPALAKKQVKAEELQFSGVGEQLPTEGTVTKAELQGLEAARTDEFGMSQDADKLYKSVVPVRARGNKTYSENIYTFKRGRGQSDLLTFEGTEHWANQPDYLMHTRTYEDTIAGQPAHVVAEIQSDLHQKGRKTGYVDAKTVPDLVEQMTQYWELKKEANEAFKADWTKATVKQNAANDFHRKLSKQYPGINRYVGEDVKSGAAEYLMDNPRVEASPYKDSWLKKGLELEVARTIGEGRMEQLAIPIKGVNTLEVLERGRGVQQWYETSVHDTAKKLAKAHNLDFKIVREPQDLEATVESKVIHPNVLRNLQELLDEAEIQEASRAALRVGYKDLSRYITKHMEDFAEGASLEELLERPSYIEYAVLSKKKDSAMKPFTLYSSPAAAAIAGAAILDSGGSEQEVVTKMLTEGYDEQEAQQMVVESKKIQEAKANGFSDEEIKASLNNLDPEVADVISRGEQ